MPVRPLIPRRISHAFLAVALVLLVSFVDASRVNAQNDLTGVRSEMEEISLRLGEMGMGLFRVTMQAPSFRSHVSLVTSLIQSVQTDLDYLEAMIQLFGLASDPGTAATVVLRELAAARERMQLDAFQQHVMEEDNRTSIPRTIQVIEQQLLVELDRVVQLYSLTSDLLEPTRQ
jgi:hypothetical protein